MSRSYVWPLLLGVLILALVAFSQMGVTADEGVKAMAAALEGLRMVAAPLLAVAALLLWAWRREPGMGFFALGLGVTGLLALTRLLGWQSPAFYLYPLHLLGVALAGII